MKKYLTIYVGETGEVYIELKTSAEILQEMAENEYKADHYLTEIPSGPYVSDGDWPVGTLILEVGKIIVPKPVEVVKKYELGAVE